MMSRSRKIPPFRANRKPAVWFARTVRRYFFGARPRTSSSREASSFGRDKLLLSPQALAPVNTMPRRRVMVKVPPNEVDNEQASGRSDEVHEEVSAPSSPASEMHELSGETSDEEESVPVANSFQVDVEEDPVSQLQSTISNLRRQQAMLMASAAIEGPGPFHADDMRALIQRLADLEEALIKVKAVLNPSEPAYPKKPLLQHEVIPRPQARQTIKPPKFRPGMNPCQFLHQFKSSMDLLGVDEVDRPTYLSFAFEENRAASTWFFNRITSKGVHDWKKVSDLFLQQFNTPNSRIDAITKLGAIRQASNESACAFAERFNSLLTLSGMAATDDIAHVWFTQAVLPHYRLPLSSMRSAQGITDVNESVEQLRQLEHLSGARMDHNRATSQPNVPTVNPQKCGNCGLRNHPADCR